MSSEERLALRAAEGDRRAFEQIYERYHQDLYRFCLAMVGNPQDAQDALQNTMVKVLRSLPGETRKIKLKPWLYRIARNESVETLRKRRDSSELEPQQAAVAAVADTAETRERLRTLLADLEQLPERQRAALVMRELSDLDFDQIGSAFGTSAAVARQTLYEARLSLRQLEAGREMRCDDVMRELSAADGRVTRRREIQAHLRTCADCRVFREEIARRHEDLAALAPLPLAASAGLLKGVIGAGAGANAAAAGAGIAGSAGAGGGLGGAVGAGAGKAIATSALVKSAATAAVVAVVGISAADRTGVIDLPVLGRDNDSAARSMLGSDRPVSGKGGNPASSTGGEDGTTPPGESRSRDASPRQDSERFGDTLDSASTHGKATARQGTSSRAGQSPPGGGYGRSAAERKGRPDELPPASAKGQQTATARRPDHVASSPGGSGQGGGHGQSAEAEAGGSPAGPAPTPPQVPPAARGPSEPSPEPPLQANAEPEVPGQGDAPPGLGH